MIRENIATFETTNIQLKIAGALYSFWKSASVHMAINEICREASFDVSDGNESRAADIAMDSPCEVICDGIRVLTGFVDDVSPSYDKSSHGITIKARSKTCDLVDCSIDLPSAQYGGQSAAGLVRTICKPFGINVRWLADDFALGEINIKTGDTAGSTIDKICKQGLLFYTDDPDGNLVVTSLADAAAVATLYNPPDDSGTNILSGQIHYSSRDRFSEYRIYSQTRPSDADDTAENAYNQSASYRDPGVRRYRPKIIVAESEMATVMNDAVARSEYMQQTAAAADFKYTMNGWKSGDGQIWIPGIFVNLSDMYARADGKFVVKSAELSISATAGRKTDLNLCYPSALIKNYKGKKVTATSKNPWYWVEEPVS